MYSETDSPTFFLKIEKNKWNLNTEQFVLNTIAPILSVKKEKTLRGSVICTRPYWTSCVAHTVDSLRLFMMLLIGINVQNLLKMVSELN